MTISRAVSHSHDNTNMNDCRKYSFLDIFRLSKDFGGIRALHEVIFSLDEGSIVSMIGPNGAGKTTLINVVTGIYPPLSGEVYFQGKNISGLQAHKVPSLGIGRTFQLTEPFMSLTVLENVMVGCHTRSRAGIFNVGLRLPFSKKEEKIIKDEAMESLKMVGLEHSASSLISSLPLGKRKLVGVARALAMKPKFLMMDEPVGGLAAHEISKVTELIYELRDMGLTIFIVEHNMPFVMSISEKVIVLSGGSKIAEGSPDDIKRNSEVINAYLGEEV